MRAPALLLPALFASLAACQGNVVTKGSGATTGPGAGVGGGGSSSSAGAGGGGGGICPASPPAAGSPCGIPTTFECTYGSSVRPECRDVWMCTDGGMWTTTHSVCLMPLPGDCGSAQPGPATVCPHQGDVCTYGNTICICDACAQGPCMAPPTTWQCIAPPASPGCPPVAPNSGTACSKEGLSCDYGFICAKAGAQAVCKMGAWQWSMDVVCGL